MAPVYRIRNPDATYTDISQYFRLYTLDVSTNAEEGSVAQSTITAHDPDGTFDIVGHRQLRISESSAAGSNTMIYVGFVGDRRVSRGPNRTTVGADWEIDLLDPNSILARRILTGSDSNRPAETDVARIQWLVSTNESGMVNDSLYVQTSGPVAMDAKDYTGQRFNEVIDDCAQASGKNYHLWWREETGTFSLWYDFDNSLSHTSPLRLTNVLADIDGVVTFAISDDTQLARSPDRVNSGVYLPYDGGTVYVQNGTTSNTYARRDVVMPAENVTTLAKATARANRYLGTMNTEEDVITTTVILPAGKQGFLMQGMRVQIKASHLPGYEDYAWTRAMNRSISQISEEFYAVKVELSPAPANPVNPANPCEGGAYELTPAGSYPPANSTVSTNGVVFYLRPGLTYPTTPSPGFGGAWHFGTMGSGGSPDYSHTLWWSVGNSLRLLAVGPGTWTIDMYGSTTIDVIARVYHAVGALEVLDSTTNGDTATPLVVTVTNDGYCIHWVDVFWGGVTNGDLGYAGAVWAPA